MATLEFDMNEFLDYFDDSFMLSVKSDNKKERDELYNNLRNEIEKFAIEAIKDKTNYMEINEIEFMLSVFEIVDNNDLNHLIDLEILLKHLQSFTKRHRNITRTLDDLNTKIMKQDMKIEKILNTEHCNYSITEALMDFTTIFGILASIFYFIENAGQDQVECDTFFGYGNDTLNCNLDWSS